jgi:ATP adenylyltransferase
MLKTIWAPWRLQYIKRGKEDDKKCVFCRIKQEKKDAKNLVVARKQYCFVVLNLYPYNNGHLLIVPYRHVKDIHQLKDEERLEIFSLMEEMKALLDETLNPHGYNIGINLGRVAGAGFPGHLHVHIVPRWQGDANFMPVIGHTKVISQSLKALYQLLKDAYKKRY